MRRLLLFLFLTLFVLPANVSQAQSDPVFAQIAALQQALTVPVVDWRFHPPGLEHGEAPTLADTDWQPVQPGFRWQGENTRAWFRARIVIPETIEGFPTTGFPVRLRIGIDDDGEIYIDGKLRAKFHWDDGSIVLTEHARPGQTFLVAVHAINGVGTGELRYCSLTYDVFKDWQPQLDRLLMEANFLKQLAQRADVPQRERIATSLHECAASLDLSLLRKGDAPDARAMLAAARGKIQPLEPLVRVRFKIKAFAKRAFTMSSAGVCRTCVATILLPEERPCLASPVLNAML